MTDVHAVKINRLKFMVRDRDSIARGMNYYYYMQWSVFKLGNFTYSS